MRTLNLFLIFFFLFALNSYSLPKCKGSTDFWSYDWNKWHNCKGTYTKTHAAYGDKIFEGEFKNGRRHGQGTETFANGEIYEGEWKDGERNGQGTHTYAYGDNNKYVEKYVGEWKDGKRSGKGTYTRAYGDKYVDKYVGEWNQDTMWGQGTFTYANGDKYVGEFKGRKRHGKFTGVELGFKKDKEDPNLYKESEYVKKQKQGNKFFIWFFLILVVVGCFKSRSKMGCIIWAVVSFFVAIGIAALLYW